MKEFFIVVIPDPGFYLNKEVSYGSYGLKKKKKIIIN